MTVKLYPTLTLRGGYGLPRFDGRDISWPQTSVDKDKVLLNRPQAKDQGPTINCCTSMAICAAFEIVDGTDGSFTPLAPMFNYYFSRPNPRYFGPVILRNALSRAARYGICRKQFYDIATTVEEAVNSPSQQALDDAKLHKLVAYDASRGIAGYYSLDGPDRLERWKAVLSQGLPIIAGIWLRSDYWEGNGMLQDEEAASIGAHAVCIVGFDNDTNTFTVLDSRGINFGITNGEWPLAYSIVQSRRIIESWTIRTISYNY